MGSVSRGWTMCWERVISLVERECEIFRASTESERGNGVLLGVSVTACRTGEGARLTSMCCSAC